MALVKCPECGKDVSNMAEYCINCGFPISGEISTIRYDINEFKIEGTKLIDYLYAERPTGNDIRKMFMGVSFYDNGELRDVFIPYGITNIGIGAFGRDRTLRSIYIPDTVVEIGESAFCDCKNIRKIEMSKNIARIEDHGFYGCLYLETVELPNRIDSIGKQCFEGCKYLKSITIPSSITHIGNLAFKNTPNLKEIYISSKSAENIKEQLKREYPEKQIIEIK